MGPRWILMTYFFQVSLHLVSHTLELLTFFSSYCLFRSWSLAGHSFVRFSILLISHDSPEFAHTARWY